MTTEPKPFSFNVRYRFDEWATFVQAHLEATLRRQGKVGADRPLPWWARAVFAMMLRPAFAYKRRQMPECRFTLSAEGITRQAGGRSSTYRWTEVASVVRYPPGFLVCLAHGAMPIPLRCLGDSDQRQLEGWLHAHGLLDLASDVPGSSGQEA